MPEGEQEMNISSREFIKKAEFINITTLQSGKKEGDTPSGSGDNGGNGSGSGSGTSSQTGGGLPDEGD